MPTRHVLLALVTIGGACDRDKPAEAAAPAQPASDPMTEYMRKSKAAEAKTVVMILARNARAFAEEEHFERDGGATKSRFPDSVGPTPPVGACCKTPNQTCSVADGDWEQRGWQQLVFEPTEPYRYSYQFESDGDTFVARAIGDLDCDGKLATYEVHGRREGDLVTVDAQPSTIDPLE